MGRTRIEWCDYTINPIKGKCPLACPYCYARRLYDRFKWNPEIRYEPNGFQGLPETPARIFVGSTIELFGPWVERDWWHMTMAKCLSRPQHTFIFLTKQPQNLPREWPSNCWVGITADTKLRLDDGLPYLLETNARVKFISFEPLLEDMKLTTLKGIDWVILGCRTQPTHIGDPAAILNILEVVEREKIPLFVKEPLRHFIYAKNQEFP